MSGYQRRSKDELARRVAYDIHDGAYVNLGIGMPTMVANHLPDGREVILHSENGLLGMGPAPVESEVDYDLINAGKQPVTLLPGGAYFHHADSFAMMRGGHLDICVLGAFQVSVTGDLANWHTGQPDSIPAVGGAMDLAVGAKQTWVMMDLLTRSGESKIVRECSFPLTAVGCVKRIYGDLATLECTPDGLVLVDLVDGMRPAGLEALSPQESSPNCSKKRPGSPTSRYSVQERIPFCSHIRRLSRMSAQKSAARAGSIRYSTVTCTGPL
jgi:3-oxoadipate CoA-transferase beta subunit